MVASDAKADFMPVSLFDLVDGAVVANILDNIQQAANANKQILFIDMDDMAVLYLANRLTLSDDQIESVVRRAISELADLSDNVTIFLATKSEELEASDTRIIEIERPDHARRIDIIGAKLVQEVSTQTLERPNLFTELDIQACAEIADGISSSSLMTAIKFFVKKLKDQPEIPLVTLNIVLREAVKNQIK